MLQYKGYIPVHTSTVSGNNEQLLNVIKQQFLAPQNEVLDIALGGYCVATLTGRTFKPPARVLKEYAEVLKVFPEYDITGLKILMGVCFARVRTLKDQYKFLILPYSLNYTLSPYTFYLASGMSIPTKSEGCFSVGVLPIAEILVTMQAQVLKTINKDMDTKILYETLINNRAFKMFSCPLSLLKEPCSKMEQEWQELVRKYHSIYKPEEFNKAYREYISKVKKGQNISYVLGGERYCVRKEKDGYFLKERVQVNPEYIDFPPTWYCWQAGILK